MPMHCGTMATCRECMIDSTCTKGRRCISSTCPRDIAPAYNGQRFFDVAEKRLDRIHKTTQMVAGIHKESSSQDKKFDSDEESSSLRVEAAKLAELLTTKQRAYGNAFGKAGGILEILYPDGVSVDQYTDFLAVTRVIDKLFRIATDKDALGESPWRDIAGYALLSLTKEVINEPDGSARTYTNKALAKNKEKE